MIQLNKIKVLFMNKYVLSFSTIFKFSDMKVPLKLPKLFNPSQVLTIIPKKPLLHYKLNL